MSISRNEGDGIEGKIVLCLCSDTQGKITKAIKRVKISRQHRGSQFRIHQGFCVIERAYERRRDG